MSGECNGCGAVGGECHCEDEVDLEQRVTALEQYMGAVERKLFQLPKNVSIGKIDEPTKDIWQAFEKVLAEHPTATFETPEEAAEKYCDQYSWHDPREEDAYDAFIAGAQWLQRNPAALANWKRKV